MVALPSLLLSTQPPHGRLYISDGQHPEKRLLTGLKDLVWLCGFGLWGSGMRVLGFWLTPKTLHPGRLNT